MWRPPIPNVTALLLLAVAPALGQMRGGSLSGVVGGRVSAGAGFTHSAVAAHLPAAGVAPQSGGTKITFGSGFHRHHHFPRSRSAPFFFGDGLFWGDQPIVEEEPVAMEKGQAAVPAIHIAEPVKPAEPLMIELQGGRFVRLTDAQVNVAQVNVAQVNQAHVDSPRTNRTQPVGDTRRAAAGNARPAVLIFRDGHQHEVSSYAIIGAALYESAGYWSAGYWTRKILLADLDLPATITANQQRGVNFMLPSAPNQVVIF
ncbi:MAG TPA: hypothetical protein VFA76_11835 [Terriglobales bacterium]|nr:hypothetical protein [Terriglobales bacterium]